MEVCNSFKIQGVHEDILRLKLFPYSLGDRAKTWLNSIPAGSIGSWSELYREFIMRFYPTNLYDQIHNEVTSFRQADDEPMYEAWERYRELLNKCPLHGFPLWKQVTMLYNATNDPKRMMLDASANDTLLDKALEEAIEILNKLARIDFQFPTFRRGRLRSQATVNELETANSVTAQLAS